MASVYHRLAFRGLLAEGLWVQTREAAFSRTPLGSNGELGLRPWEGLSLAAWNLSNVGDAARGTAAATPFAVSGFSLVVRQPPAGGRRSSGWDSWRWAIEPSWFTPPALAHRLATLPAWLAPLDAALGVNEPGEGSRHHLNPSPSLAGPPPRVVVSRPWEHGSRRGNPNLQDTRTNLPT